MHFDLILCNSEIAPLQVGLKSFQFRAVSVEGADTAVDISLLYLGFGYVGQCEKVGGIGTPCICNSTLLQLKYMSLFEIEGEVFISGDCGMKFIDLRLLIISQCINHGQHRLSTHRSVCTTPLLRVGPGE